MLNQPITESKPFVFANEETVKEHSRLVSKKFEEAMNMIGEQFTSESIEKEDIPELTKFICKAHDFWKLELWLDPEIYEEDLIKLTSDVLSAFSLINFDRSYANS